MKNYYDNISGGYNELYKREQLTKWALIKDFMHFGERVLDLGCGTGFVTKLLPGIVVGCDSSRKMLEQCPSSVRTVYCKAESLPFKDDSFDTVFSLTVLQDVKDISKAVNEIRRVLKTSGNIIISVLDKKKVNLIRKVLKEKFKKVKEKKLSKDVLFFT